MVLGRANGCTSFALGFGWCFREGEAASVKSGEGRDHKRSSRERCRSRSGGLLSKQAAAMLRWGGGSCMGGAQGLQRLPLSPITREAPVISVARRLDARRLNTAARHPRSLRS